MAAGAARAWVRGAGEIVSGGRLGGGEQPLQTAKHWALAGMEESKGTNAVQTAQRAVLEEAAQELSSG